MDQLPDGITVTDAKFLPIIAAYVNRLGIPKSAVNFCAPPVWGRRPHFFAFARRRRPPKSAIVLRRAIVCATPRFGPVFEPDCPQDSR